jgi:serine phosphatase RsbU (regulator of sigma subunit)
LLIEAARHARAGHQAAALHAVIAALSEPMARDQIARTVIERGRRALGAGTGVVALMTGRGTRLEVVATAGESERGFPGELPLDSDLPFSQALRTCRPVWSKRLAVLPLGGDRGPPGVLVLSDLGRGMLGANEKSFLVALARLCSQALTDDSLRERERAVRRRAEEASTRLALLVRAGKLLSESLDVQRTLDQFVALCVDTVADWCAIALTAEYGSARAFAGDADALRAVSHVGLASAITIPVVARGHRLGTATLGSADSGQTYGPEDVLLIEELVVRAALAIDNSALYQRQYAAARELQRSLLPSRLPTVPGVQLAGRYVQGTRGLEIGGDWYDAIELRDGMLGLAIGDVAGRGITAARIMGELRSVLRTCAFDGYTPSGAAERVNRLTETFEEHEISTLVYLVYDPHRRTARFVRAGHPPPVVLQGGSRTQVLDECGSLPLGVPGDARFVEGEVTLEPGSTLVLYTDGLIERRDRSVDEGIAALAAAIAAGPGDVGELCDHLLDRMAGPVDQADDVALLVLRDTGR